MIKNKYVFEKLKIYCILLIMEHNIIIFLPPSQTAKEQAKWAVLQNGCEYSKAQVKGREPTWHRIINPSDALDASRPELCDVAPNIQ